jgi:hypothetical protein
MRIDPDAFEACFSQVGTVTGVGVEREVVAVDGKAAGGTVRRVDADALGEQWSTVTNTAACPSPVTVVVRSVPHMVSIVSGMIVPSWVRGPRGGPVREGASRPFSRISRNVRRFDVRTPAKRSLAQTLRWPSPWKGLAASTARIASTSSASGIGPTGPGRRRGAAARGGARAR